MSLRAIIWAAVSTAPQANEDEKYSLPSQIKDAEELCEREGWTIVDTLKVPGHSRNYKSLDKLAADAAAKGIDAFYRLIDHLESCDFDVLICRDANRFARKASLLHYIVESIIEDCGARIYSFNDGWVDEQNADMFAMVKGFQTAKEMKWLKESARRGKDKLVERGLPIGSHLPITHKRVRDPVSGRDIGVELNEAVLPMMYDLATLILEGVGWNRLGHEMFVRFNHVDATGRPYTSSRFYYLVMNLNCWGHTGRGQTKAGMGRWIFDADCPPPEGVKVARNTVPAVYTGELAEKLKAELRRRLEIHGRARPSTTYRYSGLCICGECGRAMVVRSREGGQRIGLKCPTIDTQRVKSDRSGRTCTQNLMTPRRYLDAYFHELLEQIIAGETVPILQLNNPISEIQHHLALVQAEIERYDQQIATLIDEQAQAPANVQPSYRKRIAALGDKMEVAERRASELKVQLRSMKRTDQIQTRTLTEIRELSLERFWELPDREINQYLRRLFGTRRLVIMGRQVVGVVDKRGGT